MFRKMRRSGKELSREDAVEILKKGSNGVFALDGENGYPYALPISFVYADDKIYFHCSSKGGHKLDAIRRNDKVSFCVVAEDFVLPAEFNTLFRSAIAFGRARILPDGEEKQRSLELLVAKYSGDFMEKGKAAIKAEWDDVAMVEITIEHLTGKQGV